MRATRLAAGIIVSTLIILVVTGMSMFVRSTFGQALPPLAPLPSPVVLGAPSAISTVPAVPILAPAPAMTAQAIPTPAPQSFRCTCSGPGFPVAWVGSVNATNVLAASQAATGACTTFKTSTYAESRFIPHSTQPFAPSRSALPGTLGAPPPGQVGVTSSKAIGSVGTAAAVEAIPAEQCQNCACD